MSGGGWWSPTGMSTEPTARIDQRFSDAEAAPTPWSAVTAVLERAELYWITTVRADGRPHVTPLIGVWHDGAARFGLRRPCGGAGRPRPPPRSPRAARRRLASPPPPPPRRPPACWPPRLRSGWGGVSPRRPSVGSGCTSRTPPRLSVGAWG